MWTSLATFLELTASALALTSAVPEPDLSWVRNSALLGPIPEDQVFILDETTPLILDETQPVTALPEVDLGPETNLGPASLNLEAMAALDSVIADLVALESEAPTVSLPAPFACDLTAESNVLTERLLEASDEVSVAWNAALEDQGITAMAQETEAEQCAYIRAMQEALEWTAQELEGRCSPITLALRLTDTVRQVRPNAQPKWARELSLLAQKQADYTFLGKDASKLCAEYRALEAAMAGDILG